jgi:hypothetical protein
MDKYHELHNHKTNLCECSHWRHEHMTKRSWIMGVLYGAVPSKCAAKGLWGEDANCQCEGFELHIPLRDKGK